MGLWASFTKVKLLQCFLPLRTIIATPDSLLCDVLNKVSENKVELRLPAPERGNSCLPGLAGKGTKWTGACSCGKCSEQQAAWLLLLSRERGAVLQLLAGHQQERMCARTATCGEEGGGKQL